MPDLIVFARSRRCEEEVTVKTWAEGVLANQLTIHEPGAMFLVDQPPLGALGPRRGDRLVHFLDNGQRVQDGQPGRPWADAAALSADLETRARARVDAMVEAARKAHTASWKVTWVVLTAPDSPPHCGARLLAERYADIRTMGVHLIARYEDETASAHASEVVWIDTESTGLYADRHGLIELAAQVTDASSKVVKRAFHAKIKPRPDAILDPEAFRINGYTPELWHDARDEESVIREFHAWLPASFRLAGYNVQHDRKFLDAAFIRWGLAEPGWKKKRGRGSIFSQGRGDGELEVDVIDPLYKARAILGKTGKVPNCKLATLCLYYGLDTDGMHTAMADTDAARMVYLRLLGGT
jgi:DNA polymerase III epsilon subunit-like protein